LKKKVPGLEKPCAVAGIGNEAIEILMNYPGPGNSRGLKSTFEYAFVNCHEPLI
jgi:transcriptional regulator with PAS, ATPase and Fis domain